MKTSTLSKIKEDIKKILDDEIDVFQIQTVEQDKKEETINNLEINIVSLQYYITRDTLYEILKYAREEDLKCNVSFCYNQGVGCTIAINLS